MHIRLTLIQLTILFTEINYSDKLEVARTSNRNDNVLEIFSLQLCLHRFS
jgi:hypothetical protein